MATGDKNDFILEITPVVFALDVGKEVRGHRREWPRWHRMWGQFALRQMISMGCRLAQLAVLSNCSQFCVDIGDAGSPEHIRRNFRRSAMVDAVHLHQIFRFQARGDH